MNSFELNSVYNFNTLAPAILGANFKRVTVLAIVNYAIATTMANIEVNHRNIYPYLPVGTIDDPKTYQYLVIKTETGETTILALPWINLDTVNKLIGQDITIKINNVAPNDAAKIRDALIMLGFNDFNIAVV